MQRDQVCWRRFVSLRRARQSREMERCPQPLAASPLHRTCCPDPSKSVSFWVVLVVFFQWLELNYRAAFRLGTRYAFAVGSEFGSPSNSLCETSAATPRPIKPRAALMLAAPRGHHPPHTPCDVLVLSSNRDFGVGPCCGVKAGIRHA